MNGRKFEITKSIDEDCSIVSRKSLKYKLYRIRKLHRLVYLKSVKVQR